MVTEYLEKCLYLLDPNKFRDEEILKYILGGTEGIFSNFISPFRRELDRNMLTRKTPEEKKDMIIYYLSEFMRVQGKLREFNELEVETPGVFMNLHYHNQNSETSWMDQYVVNRHYLYVLLFNEIQKCCFNFKVPFMSICKELWFPIRVIDPEITLEYEKLMTRDNDSMATRPTTLQILKEELQQKGFFHLKTIVVLADPAKEKLIWIINTNELPYQIAMFDFLGFINHFVQEYGYTKTVTYSKIAEILSVTSRSVRGNILVLQEFSKEDKTRYTSYKYKVQVQNDYHSLK